MFYTGLELAWQIIMHFTYYTLKNVKQCAQAVNERIKAPDGGKSRPAMDGNVDAKTGDFTLALATPVAFGMSRQTQLRGSLTRDGNYTTIQGDVSEGVPPGKIRLVIGALVIVGFIIMAQGLVALGILTAGIGIWMYVPLVGDHRNSAVLIREVKRLLDAKDKPPA
jgi:hypothetical protein